MLPIYLYGHPLLRNKSVDIDPNADYLPALIQQMYQTMYESDGIGLAAPQIGRNIRLIVIDATPMADQYPECAGMNLVLINPYIEEQSGTPVSETEGCLSIPGIAEPVQRPSRILLRYIDQQGTEHHESYDGFAARVIQHEYDHLEGVLFTDRVSPLRRQLIKTKLAAIARGKVRPHYPSVPPPAKRH